jgi:hypothetical protein
MSIPEAIVLSTAIIAVAIVSTIFIIMHYVNKLDK